MKKVFFLLLIICSLCSCKLFKKTTTIVHTDIVEKTDSVKTTDNTKVESNSQKSELNSNEEKTETTIVVTFADSTKNDISFEDLNKGIFNGKNVQKVEIRKTETKKVESARNEVENVSVEVAKDSVSVESEKIDKSETKEKDRQEVSPRLKVIGVVLAVIIIVFLLFKFW